MSSAAVVIGDLRVNRLTSELKPDFSDMRKTLLGRHVLNSFAMEKWKFGIPAMEPCTIVWQWKTEKNTEGEGSWPAAQGIIGARLVQG